MKCTASKSMYGNSGMAYDLRLFSPENLIMEIITGVVPMLIIFILSNGYSDFASQVENYIPSQDIQWAFVCCLAFGLALSFANFRLRFSPFLLRISFASVSACCSMLQALAGILIFFSVYAVWRGAFRYLIFFVPGYLFFHLFAANLTVFINRLRRRYL